MALQMRLSQRERGGCFRDGVGAAGSSPWRRGALLAGRRLFGVVGCPLGILCGFFVQSPSRSRSEPWRGGGVRFVALGVYSIGAAWPLLSGNFGVLSWQSANQTTDLRVAPYPIASV